jgi:hypothetical protein
MSSKIKPSAIALAILVGLVLLWYWPEDTRCSLQDLILKDEKMPAGWQRTWYILPPALPDESAQDALGVQFDQNNTSFAHHTLYRYRNRTEALLWRRINRELFFPSSWHWVTWEASGGWALAADEISVQCAETGAGGKDSFRCNAVMRYGPMIADFGSPIRPGLMTLQEFHDIVVAIDKDSSACLR